MRSESILHLKIFVSSPGDLHAERKAVSLVIDKIRREPLLRDNVSLQEISWDQPGLGAPMLANLSPQDAINRGMRKPSECDVVIVIFATRMGTPLPNKYRKPDGTMYLSGTEWEYLDALNGYMRNGRPEILVYRRFPLPPLSNEDLKRTEKQKQRRLVDQFFVSFTSTDGSLLRGYNKFKSLDDFETKLLEHLKVLIRTFLENINYKHNINLKLEKGIKFLKNGDFISAQRLFQRLTDEYPDESKVYYYRAISLFQGRPPQISSLKVAREAEQLVKTSLELNPDEGRYDMFLAVLRYYFYNIHGLRSPEPSFNELIISAKQKRLDANDLKELFGLLQINGKFQ